MSEVDVHGTVLCSFKDVSIPNHLSLDNEGHVLVADFGKDRILLLNSQLQLQRVLVDTNSQVKLCWPQRLCYNELTSQLYVLHSRDGMYLPEVISLFHLLVSCSSVGLLRFDKCPIVSYLFLTLLVGSFDL